MKNWRIKKMKAGFLPCPLPRQDYKICVSKVRSGCKFEGYKNEDEYQKTKV